MAVCEFSKLPEQYSQAFESVKLTYCLLSQGWHDFELADLTTYVAFIIDLPITSRFATSVQRSLSHTGHSGSLDLIEVVNHCWIRQ